MLAMNSWDPDYLGAASGLFTLVRAQIGGIIIDNPAFNVQYGRCILLSDLSKRTLCYQMLNALATELGLVVLLPRLPIYVLKKSYIKNCLMDVYDDSVESLCDKALS